MAPLPTGPTRTNLPQNARPVRCPFCGGNAANWLGATDNGVRGHSPVSRLATTFHCREQSRYRYRVTNGTQKARDHAYRNKLRRAYGERLAGVIAW